MGGVELLDVKPQEPAVRMSNGNIAKKDKILLFIFKQ